MTSLQRQIDIMETQLSVFDDLSEKMQYMSDFFGMDPAFTKEARDIVRGNICLQLKQPTNRETK